MKSLIKSTGSAPSIYIDSISFFLKSGFILAPSSAFLGVSKVRAGHAIHSWIHHRIQIHATIRQQSEMCDSSKLRHYGSQLLRRPCAVSFSKTKVVLVAQQN